MSAVAATTIAKCVLKAARIREESYNKEGADAVVVSGNLMANFEDFYEITLKDAAELACLEYPGLAESVYLILGHCWNDGLEWATSIAERGGACGV